MITTTGSLTPTMTALILGSFTASLIIHELMHILAFLTMRVPFEVSFSRKALGVAVTPRTRPPRYQVTLASLAPLLPALLIIALNPAWFRFPMDWRWALTLGAVFIALLPSPGDLFTALMYHPHAPEVRASG